MLYNHAVFRCQPLYLSSCQSIGGPTQKLLSKSRLFTCPDDCNTLMVAAGDESLSSVSFPQALVYSSFIMFLCSKWYLQCCTWSLNTSGVAKSDDKFNPFTFKISRITLFPTCINSFLQWKVFIVWYQKLDSFFFNSDYLLAVLVI